MNDILLCSHDPMLVKSLYGMLRDLGYNIHLADHPSLAVRMVLKNKYNAVIIDSEPFGLSSEEAVSIISAVWPEMRVIPVRAANLATDFNAGSPFDPEKVREVLNQNHI